MGDPDALTHLSEIAINGSTLFEVPEVYYLSRGMNLIILHAETNTTVHIAHYDTWQLSTPVSQDFIDLLDLYVSNNGTFIFIIASWDSAHNQWPPVLNYMKSKNLIPQDTGNLWWGWSFIYLSSNKGWDEYSWSYVNVGPSGTGPHELNQIITMDVPTLAPTMSPTVAFFKSSKIINTQNFFCKLKL